MTNRKKDRRTHLFTLRLWLEPLDGFRAEIRGEARNCASGERRYFRSGAALEGFLVETLSKAETIPEHVLLHAEWFTAPR